MFEQGPKSGHFLKGLVHGFCPKIKYSISAVFYWNYVRKDRFSIFINEIMILGGKNWSFKKGPKNGQFPKGLVHGFCPKIEISHMGVLYRNYVRKNGF